MPAEYVFPVRCPLCCSQFNHERRPNLSKSSYSVFREFYANVLLVGVRQVLLHRPAMDVATLSLPAPAALASAVIIGLVLIAVLMRSRGKDAKGAAAGLAASSAVHTDR